MSSSSSAMERARMPVLRMFIMASSGRRLTVPFLVTMKMYMSPSSRTCSMALTFSPGSTGMMFTILVPRAVRPASGN